MTSVDREALRQTLIRHEREVLHAYQDSLGFWTIGCGHLIDQRKGGGISPAIARAILDADINACLDDLTGCEWFFHLDGVRQRALIDMRFQLGWAGLLTFERLLDAVKRRDWVQAKAEVLHSAYATQTPGRAQENADMLATGTDGPA